MAYCEWCQTIHISGCVTDSGSPRAIPQGWQDDLGAEHEFAARTNKTFQFPQVTSCSIMVCTVVLVDAERNVHHPGMPVERTPFLQLRVPRSVS